jgi:O-antigen/teichoic acid export membrane protein
MANASTRQLLVNFLTGYLGLAVSIILSLFVTPIALHYLGSSTYGLWILIVTVGGYVGLLDAGVSTAAAQMVASATANREDDRVGDILAAAQAFFSITALLAVAITAALLPLFGHVFNVGAEPIDRARLAFFLGGIFLAFNFLTSVPQSALFGGGKVSRSSVLGAVMGFVVQGGQIIVVLLGGGLVGLMGVAVVGALVTYVGTRQIAVRLELQPRRWKRPSRPVARELLRSGSRNALISLGGTISYALDAVVVGIILPVRAVAPYDIGLSAANFVRNAATTATALLLPAYAHSSALRDEERQFRLYSRSVLASMTITVPMAVSLAVFGEPILRLWLGHVPDHTFQVMVALNIVLLLQLPGQQAFVFLTGIGRNKLLARIALPAAIVNLGLSILATFWLGPVGPAIGSLPQVLILDFSVFPVLACRAMGAPVRRYLREALLPLTVPLVASVAVALGLLALVGDHSKLLAPLECVAVTLVSWAVLVPVLAKVDPILRASLHEILHHLRDRIRR